MKIECIKEKLLKALSHAERVTGKNLTLTVLNCVLFEAKGSTLTVKATNLEIGIEISIPVKVEKEGKVAVPGGILLSHLSNIHSDRNIKLELIDNNLSISTSETVSLIKTQSSEDFPVIPKISDGSSVSMSAKNLTEGFKAVYYSSSVSNIKPELASVFVYFEDGRVVYVATDSFRLAEKKIVEKKAKDFESVLIPYKNVAEIIKIVSEYDKDVEVVFGENQISVSFDGVYLTSRIVDGTFPDYKQIIPKEFSTEVILLKQDLINSLKLSNVFIDKFNQMTMRIYPSKKSFKIETKNSDVGENVSVIKSNLSGEDLDISFNQKYVSDCLQSISADSLVLRFAGLNKPLVIRSVPDDNFMYLVMPMNK